MMEDCDYKTPVAVDEVSLKQSDSWLLGAPVTNVKSTLAETMCPRGELNAVSRDRLYGSVTGSLALTCPAGQSYSA